VYHENLPSRFPVGNRAGGVGMIGEGREGEGEGARKNEKRRQPHPYRQQQQHHQQLLVSRKSFSIHRIIEEHFQHSTTVVWFRTKNEAGDETRSGSCLYLMGGKVSVRRIHNTNNQNENSSSSSPNRTTTTLQSSTHSVGEQYSSGNIVVVLVVWVVPLPVLVVAMRTAAIELSS